MTDQFARVNNTCIVIITIILVTFSLNFTKPVLVPFVFAFIIYEILNPMINFMQSKLKLNRVLSTFITMAVIIFFLSLAIFFIANSLEHFIKSANVYKNRLVTSIQWFSDTAHHFGYDINASVIQAEIREMPLLKMANNVTGNVLGFIGSFFLISVMSLFLVLGGTTKESSSQTVRDIQNKVSRYLATKFFTSTVTGLVTWIFLIIGKVDLALMFGIITILLNFIPTVGSILATTLPLPIILLQYGLGWQFYFVLIGTSFAQIIIGNIIEPKLMGVTLDLHPISLLISLIFWGLVWGLPGMFLAVPITASVKLVFDRIEATRPLAELLAGRFNPSK
ncbi:MAG: AI-2E family transporter [Halobacteriovoraceae bacterium]|nr:AI-2E family transporter [Halobacteriovoraceae bacterium]